MAGFFGLFNYDREGPGVEKNAPKKKSFIVFFELLFKNFWKLAVNSIWYWMLTIFLPTGGLAAAGITNITRNMAIDRHSFGTHDFFDTIKKNWKQALTAGIINTIIIAFLVWDIYFFYTYSEGAISLVCIAICATVLLVFLMMRYYIWVILISFKLKLKEIYINSFKLSLVGLKSNLVIFLGMVLIYAICFGLFWVNVKITLFLLVLIVLFFLPGYRFLLIQFNVFKNIKKYMIDPYYSEHPDEDIELRRGLGLLDGEDRYDESDLL